MSGNVNFDPKGDLFSEYQVERKGRKENPDALDQIFQKRRESPVSQAVVDEVVDGAYGKSNDLFSGLTPSDKA